MDNQGVPATCENYLAIGASARGRSMPEHGLLAATLVWVNTQNDPWVVQETLIKVKPTRAQVKDGGFRTREEKDPLEQGDDICDTPEIFVRRLEGLVKDLPFENTVLLLIGQDAWSAARYYYDLSRVSPTLVQRPWKRVEYVHNNNVPYVLTSDWVRAWLNSGEKMK
jgi:hypothetical protein